MKRIRILSVLLSFYLSSFVPLSANDNSLQTINIGIYLHQDFTQKDEHNNYYGYGMELYKAIATHNRYRFKITECTLANCLLLLANQEIDLLSGITYSDSRAKNFIFSSQPIGTQTGELYVRDPSIPYGITPQLQGLSIGLVEGGYYPSRFVGLMNEELISFTPIYEESMYELIQLFEERKIDGFVSSNGITTKEAHSVLKFDTNYIYLISSPNHIKLMDEINVALASMDVNANVDSTLDAKDITKKYPNVILTIVLFTLAGIAFFSYYVSINYKQHQKRLALNNKRLEILKALELNSFFLVYQPIVDIKKKQITHLEALIRWNHITRGLLSPFQFLNDINQSNLMVEVFQFTFIQILVDYKDSYQFEPQFTHEEFKICINITYTVLTSDTFISFVDQKLQEYGVLGSIVCFEVTEQMLHENLELFNKQIGRLRALGCHIAMDDFGMEYSSLLSLKQSDYDIYKIDKYFIDEILLDKTCQSIANAIVAIGQILNKQVIAEGVEDETQVNQLHAMGCYLIQGYYFSRPQKKSILVAQLPSIMTLVSQEVPYE